MASNTTLIAALLQAIQAAQPGLRVGQIITNALTVKGPLGMESNKDLFYISDEELRECLKKYLIHHVSGDPR